MKKYILIASILFTFLTVLFLIAEIFHIPLLTDNRFAGLAGPYVCWIGFLLLTVDVFIPVPSSLVMITLGSSLGMISGALWAFGGVMGAAIVGFAAGRFFKPVLRFVVSEKDREQANAFINKWGMVGIIVTRPMPLFAETLVLVAGTTNFSWKKLFFASIAGNLPIAVLYAWTGATAKSINAGIWSFLFAIGTAGIFWFTNYYIAQRRKSSKAI